MAWCSNSKRPNFDVRLWQEAHLRLRPDYSIEGINWGITERAMPTFEVPWESDN